MPIYLAKSCKSFGEWAISFCVIVYAWLPWACWVSALVMGRVTTRGSCNCGGSWREWSSLFKSSSPGDVIIGFSIKEKLVSSNKRRQATSTGKEDSGQLGVSGLSVSFQYNQMSLSHILGLHFSKWVPSLLHEKLSETVNSNDVKNSTTHTTKFFVWFLAISAHWLQ